MVKKKAAMTSLQDRKKMIRKEDNEFNITEQCNLLSINRSSFYYHPVSVAEDDLRLMRIMDELYLEDPTRGTRRYSDELTAIGYKVGRDKVRSLMRVMCIYSIYCKPRTTVIDPAK